MPKSQRFWVGAFLPKDCTINVAGKLVCAAYVCVCHVGLTPEERFNVRHVQEEYSHFGYCHHALDYRFEDFDFVYLCACEDAAVADLAETGFILAFGTWRDVTGTWGLNMTLGAGAGEVRTQT